MKPIKGIIYIISGRAGVIRRPAFQDRYPFLDLKTTYGNPFTVIDSPKQNTGIAGKGALEERGTASRMLSASSDISAPLMPEQISFNSGERKISHRCPIWCQPA